MDRQPASRQLAGPVPMGAERNPPASFDLSNQGRSSNTGSWLTYSKEYGSGFSSGFLRYLDTGDLADVVVDVVTDDAPHVVAAINSGGAPNLAAALAPSSIPALTSCEQASPASSISFAFAPATPTVHHLHGLLLARHSAFFAAALGQQHFADSAARRIRLTLDPEAVIAWPILVRYFYTDLVRLNDVIALPLLALSRQLLVLELDVYCADYIRGRLCAANCLDHLRASVRFSLHDLHGDCVALAAQGFPLLYDSDLSGLPPASLLEVLMHPLLQVHCELQVVEAITRYLASTAVDTDAARALCAQIRFPYLDNATITRLAAQPNTAIMAVASAGSSDSSSTDPQVETPSTYSGGAVGGASTATLKLSNIAVHVTAEAADLEAASGSAGHEHALDSDSDNDGADSEALQSEPSFAGAVVAPSVPITAAAPAAAAQEAAASPLPDANGPSAAAAAAAPSDTGSGSGGVAADGGDGAGQPAPPAGAANGGGATGTTAEDETELFSASVSASSSRSNSISGAVSHPGAVSTIQKAHQLMAAEPILSPYQQQLRLQARQIQQAALGLSAAGGPPLCHAIGLSLVPRELALEGALARLAAMEYHTSLPQPAAYYGAFAHASDYYSPPGAAATAANPAFAGPGPAGGAGSVGSAAHLAATASRRPLAWFRVPGGPQQPPAPAAVQQAPGGMVGAAAGAGGGGMFAAHAPGHPLPHHPPPAHLPPGVIAAPNPPVPAPHPPHAHAVYEAREPQRLPPHTPAAQHPPLSATTRNVVPLSHQGWSSENGGADTVAVRGGGGTGAHVVSGGVTLYDNSLGVTALACCLPPPRPSYCCNLSHGLPGGCSWVDVALEAVWEHLVPYVTVQASGCGEGDPQHVVTADPDCFFETNDSSESLPWIEIQLPHNVHVLSLHRFTFLHGHRRAGYYRARNFKTQIAVRPASEIVATPSAGAADAAPNADAASEGGSAAGAPPVPAAASPLCRYFDLTTRMTEQFDVGVLAGANALGPWRVLRLQATGPQEDGVHRLCVRSLRMYGVARIDLMHQANGFLVHPQWLVNARIDSGPACAGGAAGGSGPYAGAAGAAPGGSVGSGVSAGGSGSGAGNPWSNWHGGP